MGIDVYALVTDWQPAVDDCRAAGGLDFYWDAVHEQEFSKKPRGAPVAFWVDDEVLPYAIEYWEGAGKFFTSLPLYFYAIEDFLPEPERRQALEFLTPICSVYEDEERRIDDLATDAGLEWVQDVLYSLRPSTVPEIRELAGTMPWQALEKAADEAEQAGALDGLDRMADHHGFESVVGRHISWMEQAAASGRGLIVHWTY